MTDDRLTIEEYFTAMKQVMDDFPTTRLETFLSVLREAREREAAVFICGNGGSWATAAHMVCDFGKNTRMPGSKRMKVIGLGDMAVKRN